jgi:ABC-type multidrug transport system fused ATPase/permease subunit
VQFVPFAIVAPAPRATPGWQMAAKRRETGSYSQLELACALAAPPQRPPSSRSACSALLFWWATPLIRLGGSRPLQPADLWELAAADQPAQLRLCFEAAWAAAPRRAPAARMFLACVSIFRRELAASGLLTVLSTACQFGAPTFIRAIVNYADATNDARGAGRASPSLADGVLLALGMLAVQVLGCLLAGHASFLLVKIGMRSRAMLTSAVYHRSLHLTDATAAGRGRLLTLLSQDCSKVEQGIQLFHRAWMAPFFVLAGLAYIGAIIGAAVLFGFAFMCAAMPPVRWIAGRQRAAQQLKMAHTDRRIRAVDEALQAMKAVKLGGWEEVRKKLGQL